MSSIQSQTPMGIGHVDPQNLVGHLDDVKSTATQSLQQALVMMQQAIAGNFSLPEGAPRLEAPAQNVNDMTLRIGLLQDALSQLQQQVSKIEIKGRMEQMQEANRAQLEKIEKQMEEAQKAADKNREAQKKSNIFSAIGNWFKAAFDFVCAALTFITAVAYLFVNPVAAVGLFVAGACMVATGVISATLAIDASIKLAGGEGIGKEHLERMQKASEILGYIAMGATVLSGIGVGVASLRQLARSGVDVGFKQGAMIMLKSLAGNLEQAGANALQKLSAYTNVIQAVGTATTQGISGGGKLVTADLLEDAAVAKRDAELAEAQAKALEAVAKMLRKMIEQLEAQLEDMVNSCLDSVSAIYNALDESQQSMQELFRAQTA